MASLNPKYWTDIPMVYTFTKPLRGASKDKKLSTRALSISVPESVEVGKIQLIGPDVPSGFHPVPFPKQAKAMVARVLSPDGKETRGYITMIDDRRGSFTPATMTDRQIFKWSKEVISCGCC